MATAPTGTTVSSGPGVTHETEDLSDVIARIDPSEVPVYSNLSKGTATSIKHEWTVQELLAVDGTNRKNEGFEPDYETLKVPNRMDNYTQISSRAGIVSGTYDAVDTVGGSDRESTRQKVMKGLELRRDLELIVTQHQAKSGADPRAMGAIPSWISNAVVEGASTVPTGDGSDVSDLAGTDVAFASIAKVDAALLMAHLDGGKPKTLNMSPKLKTDWSKIPDATAGAGSIYVTKPDTSGSQFTFHGASDAYHSDWGAVEVVSSIHMQKGLILALDPNYIKACALPGRNFAAKDIAVTGDSRRFMVVYEGTIEATAPKAHAMAVDLIDA